MIPTQSGSFRLFRVAGIQVSLHWMWFLVAWYFITVRAPAYRSVVWSVAEYLALFLIVLLHEFGHALACRQTGGTANQIILWPLGGVAFVRPPPRPGAELWSIAAGPLVNVCLIPVIFGAMWARRNFGWGLEIPDARRLLINIAEINFGLLVFNLLPLYPLDGGQIVRSLLWFPLGRARSLHVATIFGLVGIPLIGVYAYLENPGQWLWILVMGGFLAQQCFAGFKHAQALRAVERMPRHPGFACPACHQAPPGGPHWLCQGCGNRFDPFSTRAVCPHCQKTQDATPCAHCGQAHPFERWSTVRWDDGLPPVQVRS